MRQEPFFYFAAVSSASLARSKYSFLLFTGFFQLAELRVGLRLVKRSASP
jgi:hypothetical protein